MLLNTDDLKKLVQERKYCGEASRVAGLRAFSSLAIKHLPFLIPSCLRVLVPSWQSRAKRFGYSGFYGIKYKEEMIEQRDPPQADFAFFSPYVTQVLSLNTSLRLGVKNLCALCVSLLKRKAAPIFCSNFPALNFMLC